MSKTNMKDKPKYEQMIFNIFTYQLTLKKLFQSILFHQKFNKFYNNDYKKSNLKM
jgi:hypothetical protein